MFSNIFFVILSCTCQDLDIVHFRTCDKVPSLKSLIFSLENGDEHNKNNASFQLTYALRHCSQAKPFLIRWLQDPRNHYTYDAIEALGRLGADGKDAINVIALNLGKNRLIGLGGCYPDDDRIDSAALALSRIGIDSIPELIRVLRLNEPGRSDGAADALGRIGVGSHEVVSALIEALDGEAWLSASIALGRIGKRAESASPKIMNLLRKPKTFQNKIFYDEAKYLVLSLKSMGVIPMDLFETAIRDRNSDAIESLSWIGSEADPLVPLLISSLNDEDIRVVSASIFALGRIGRRGKQVVPALLKLEGSVELGSSLADCLGSFGSEAGSAVPFIIMKLTKSDGSDFPHYLHALKEIDTGHKVVLDALDLVLDGKISFKEEDYNDICKYSSSIAGYLGRSASSVVPALLKMIKREELKLKDKDLDYRLIHAAMIALGRIGKDARSSIPEMSNMLNDKEFRSFASFVLGRIGEDSIVAVPQLLRILENMDIIDMGAEDIVIALLLIDHSIKGKVIKILNSPNKKFMNYNICLRIASALGENCADIKSMVRFEMEDLMNKLRLFESNAQNPMAEADVVDAIEDLSVYSSCKSTIIPTLTKLSNHANESIAMSAKSAIERIDILSSR